VKLIAARGARVNITVSSGATAAGGVSVPDLVGKTVTEAEKALQAQGLNVGNITYQLSYELIPNTVVEQFPRAGESVPPGKKIDLFVVKVGRPTEEIQSQHP
jgi:serine/threonine-protein kinase